MTGGAPSGGTGTGGNTNVGGQTPPVPATGPCDFAAQNIVDVANAKALSSALAAAGPQTLIRLAPGNYRGPFTISRSGREGGRAILCGPRTAVLETGSNDDVIILRASDWVLSGFSVTGGQRGILMEASSRSLIANVRVFHIGQEGIHLRKGSVNNIVKGCEVTDTGFVKPEFGEGIYIGSSESVWAQYGGGANVPDRSDNNQIIGNVVGPNVRAEAVDIKEGTSKGSIVDNTFLGKGMSGQGYADSWVDVKGNGYTVRGNKGQDALVDGFQVHVILPGWGEANVFENNKADVNGAGYGFWIEKSAKGNKIGCNNEASGAAKGLANVLCVEG